MRTLNSPPCRLVRHVLNSLLFAKCSRGDGSAAQSNGSNSSSEDRDGANASIQAEGVAPQRTVGKTTRPVRRVCTSISVWCTHAGGRGRRRGVTTFKSTRQRLQSIGPLIDNRSFLMTTRHEAGTSGMFVRVVPVIEKGNGRRSRRGFG